MVKASTETELRAAATDVIRGEEGSLERAVEALLLDAARRRQSEQNLHNNILSLSQKVGGLVSEDACQNRRDRLAMADEMTSKELADVYKNLPQAIHSASKQAIDEGLEHAAYRLKLDLKSQVREAVREDTGVIHIGHLVEGANAKADATSAAVQQIGDALKKHVDAEEVRPTMTDRMARGAKQWVSILTLIGLLLAAMLFTARYFVYVSNAVKSEASEQEKKIDHLIDVTSDLARRTRSSSKETTP